MSALGLSLPLPSNPTSGIFQSPSKQAARRPHLPPAIAFSLSVSGPVTSALPASTPSHTTAGSKHYAMSRFVSGGTDEDPTERDDAWLKAQQQLDAAAIAKQEAARAGGGKSLFETLQANKGV
jgi:hypothetical protein